jgi:hypothetical protein
MKPLLLPQLTTNGSKTVLPIQQGCLTQAQPEFLEIPDLFTLYRIRRTMAFKGIREGWFKSVLLRQKGNKSGKRLVHAESVREWLLKQMDGK